MPEVDLFKAPQDQMQRNQRYSARPLTYRTIRPYGKRLVCSVYFVIAGLLRQVCLQISVCMEVKARTSKLNLLNLTRCTIAKCTCGNSRGATRRTLKRPLLGQNRGPCACRHTERCNEFGRSTKQALRVLSYLPACSLSPKNTYRTI